MSQLIDMVREKYPAYKDISDDELTAKIGAKYPVYLEKDAEFAADFTRLSARAFNEPYTRFPKTEAETATEALAQQPWNPPPQAPEASPLAKIAGTPLKAAAALDQAIVESGVGTGKAIERLSDPGARRNNYREHERAAILAGELQTTEGRASGLLDAKRDLLREQLTANGRAFSQGAGDAAEEFKLLRDATQGYETPAAAAEMIGGALPFVAEAAIPVFGQALAVTQGALSAAGSVWEQAYEHYRQTLSESEATKQADELAGKAGAANAILFAGLPGPGAKAAAAILGDRLVGKPVSEAVARTVLSGTQAGAIVAADKAFQLIQAKSTYRPDLTAGEAAEEIAATFGGGAVAGGILHGAGEVSRFAKVKAAAAQAINLPPGNATPEVVRPDLPPVEPVLSASGALTDANGHAVEQILTKAGDQRWVLAKEPETPGEPQPQVVSDKTAISPPTADSGATVTAPGPVTPAAAPKPEVLKLKGTSTQIALLELPDGQWTYGVRTESMGSPLHDKGPKFGTRAEALDAAAIDVIKQQQVVFRNPPGESALVHSKKQFEEAQKVYPWAVDLLQPATRDAAYARGEKPVEKPAEEAKPEPVKAAPVPPVTGPAVKEGVYTTPEESIRQLAELINAGKITKKLTQDILAKQYGGTMAQGKFTVKDMGDAIEQGINRALLDNPMTKAALNSDASGAEAYVRYLKEMMAKTPTQTSRTAEMDKLQQFSTPPPLSYVASWVANLRPGDVVLEPSIGVGGLAVFPKAYGATVVGNELSARRAKAVRESGLADFVTEHNAEHLNALMKPAIDKGELPKPSAVIMNPPFSNAAMTDRKNTLVGGKHVEEALKMLPPGGRLVAIVGNGMALERPMFKAWWKKISEQYNVRANIQVNGAEYKKYGTAFDNQIVVIDNTGKTPDVTQIVRGRVEKVEDLPALLERIRDERPTVGAVEPTPVKPSGAETPGVSGAGTAPRHPNDAPSGAGTPGAGGSGPGPGPAKRGKQGAVRLGPAKSGKASGSAEPPGGKPDAGLGGESRPEVGSKPDSGHAKGSEQVAEQLGISLEKLDEARHQLTETGVFSEYQPRKVRVAGAKPHPTALVEPTAMAAVDPVDPTYVPKLPREMITSGKLSATGIEQVVYAGQSHQRILPNGDRQGYFIGDGTGVGKGRQIVGIIMDNWNQGRRKAVWVSKNVKLINDAKRDFNDMGFEVTKVIDFQKNNGNLLVGAGDGVAFVPYSSLRSQHAGLDPQGKLFPPELDKENKPKLSRMHHLERWLGKDWDGVIVFDEAHLAGNAVDVKGKRGIKPASEQGKMVIDIQRLFPKARVVYSSATGATDVVNLSFADRLGIWGHGTPFTSKQQFFTAIKAGGLSAMEIVARDLKSMGRYLARTLSFEGVSHRQLVHKLTPEQNAVYDELARAWQYVLQHRNETMAQTGAANDGHARNAANSAFYGAQQRFYNSLLTALQMPSILKDIKVELAKGNSAVLQLVNTDAAVQGRQIAKAASEAVEGVYSLDDVDTSPKETLLQYIANSYPTQLYEKVQDADGNVVWRPVRDKEGQPVQDPQAIQRRQALLDQVALLKAPTSPLGMLLDTFGVENVSEVTGRPARIVERLQKDGTRKKVLEKNRGPAVTESEAKEFQAGKRRILVFSDAGGTGFSYNASRKAANQQRRIHYLMQAGWKADAALQGFGRTHRADSVSAPDYVLASTDIKGHQRFISTIARRLSELGALTGGERKSAGGAMFDEMSNLENEYAEDAVFALFHDMYSGRVPGVNFSELSRKLGYTKTVINERSGAKEEVNTLINKDSGGLNADKVPTIQQFLNRILSLEVAEQNHVFDAFLTMMKNRIEAAKSDGSYDPGTQTLKALAIRKIKDEQVYKDPDSTAATRLVEIEHDHPQRIFEFEHLHSGEPVQDFVMNNRSKRVYAIKRSSTKTLEDGRVVQGFHKISPGGWDSVIADELLPKDYTKLDESAARTMWAEQLAKLPKVRTETDTYVVGAFLPIWDRLELNSPKIWRITTDKSETMLGAFVPPRMVQGVRQRLGAGMVKQSPEDVFAGVLARGLSNTLANGWKIRRVRVGGENRIEVDGPQLSDIASFQEHIGGFMERIQYKPRFFLPTDETAGVAAMTKLLTKSPIIQEHSMVRGEADPHILESSIRNPINPNLSQPEKVTALKALADQTAPLVQKMVDELKSMGMAAKMSHKLPERILAKANRPTIKAAKPWFDVEHVRDSLRFKAALENFDQFGQVAELVQRHGFKIIKMDTAKMLDPLEWGWRFAGFDLQAPNGQLVEFYAPFKELDAKPVKGPNHELFEKWRGRDPTKMSKAESEQYERDTATSFHRYQAAWESALSRLGLDENTAKASWTRALARVSSQQGRKLSLSSSAEGAAPDGQPNTQEPSGNLRANSPPGPAEGQTTASPLSATDTLGLGSSFITPKDSTGGGETEHSLLGNLGRGVSQDLARLRAAVAPHTLGDSAAYAGNLLRELNSKMANEMERADKALRPFRNSFDRTPVPKDWQYDPARPLPRNLAFVDAFEGGTGATLGPLEAAAVGEFRQQNAEWIKRVHSLGTGALQTLITNYFPHLWDNPTKAQSVMAAILAKQPLEGQAGFLKKRTYQLFREGLAAGLKPVHDNPVDLWLLKKREVERFILAHEFINQMKLAGHMKFVYVFARGPDGWATVNDKAFSVYGPPNVKVKEAFDAGMREKTLEVLDHLGVPHERLVKLGGEQWGRTRYVTGTPHTETIATKFGGPDFAMWHELGHALNNRYSDMEEITMGPAAERQQLSVLTMRGQPIPTALAKTHTLNTELRALADQRIGATSTAAFAQHVRTTPEKMAVILQAYLHAPDLMAKVAPTVKAAFERFMQVHPELMEIDDIRPTLRLGEAEAEIGHGGLLKMGNWYMPAEAAQLVNNYLSPGLNSHQWYRTLRETSNLLNGLQLGLSGFHLGFTSLDAMTSRLAIGIEDAMAGKPFKAALTIATVPQSLFTNIWAGHKIKKEVLRPGSTDPQTAALVRALEAGGGRVGQDAFWRTAFSRRMMRALHEGTATGYVKGTMIAPFALFEQTMRPIMEFVVPRQKLGVFADMAKRGILKLGPGASAADVREEMRKAWDSVDNRMGQLVYDNLFYNRMVKDVALLSFRAFGWQLGKYREGLGAIADTASAVKSLARLEKPEFTHRMAYVIALPLMVGALGGIATYLMTGTQPNGKDWFMPRTGEKDRNGNDVRVNFPSYIKDVIAYKKHPVTSFGHSLNPLGALIMDLLQNKDFYDVKIRNPDDPFVSQLVDVAKYIGKQFVPFSISGAIKMRQDEAPVRKQMLPFFGITPVPSRITMTPAQELAAELTSERFSGAGRTKEQFDRGRLIGEIVKDLKAGKVDAAAPKFMDGITNQQLNEGATLTIIEKLGYTPLQFQVHHMDSDSAMKVWRVASSTEKEQIRKLVVAKVALSQTLTNERKAQYLREMMSGR